VSLDHPELFQRSIRVILGERHRSEPGRVHTLRGGVEKLEKEDSINRTCLKIWNWRGKELWN